jgi:hypothetical protein
MVQKKPLPFKRDAMGRKCPSHGNANLKISPSNNNNNNDNNNNNIITPITRQGAKMNRHLLCIFIFLQVRDYIHLGNIKTGP